MLAKRMCEMQAALLQSTVPVWISAGGAGNGRHVFPPLIVLATSAQRPDAHPTALNAQPVWSLTQVRSTMKGPPVDDDGVGVVAANEGVDSVVALGEGRDGAGGGALPEAQPATNTTERAATIPNRTLRAP